MAVVLVCTEWLRGSHCRSAPLQWYSGRVQAHFRRCHARACRAVPQASLAHACSMGSALCTVIA